MAYGLAKHIRDALPKASFIGFTGTPIEAEDRSTPAVFGEYIDIYDIQRAVEDEATVPIYYESRLARVDLDEAAKAELEGLFDEVAEEAGLIEGAEAEAAKARNARVEAIVGADQRIERIARDLVEPRWGCRRIQVLLARYWRVNLKRVHRLYRLERPRDAGAQSRADHRQRQ